MAHKHTWKELRTGFFEETVTKKCCGGKVQTYKYKRSTLIEQCTECREVAGYILAGKAKQRKVGDVADLIQKMDEFERPKS